MNSKKQNYSAPMCAVHTLAEETTICTGSVSFTQNGTMQTGFAPERRSFSQNRSLTSIEADGYEDYEEEDI